MLIFFLFPLHSEFFDDMSTQITVEFLIRPGSRVPVKIARQLVHDDQIIAVAPIHPQTQSAMPSTYIGNGQNTAAIPSDNVAQQNSAPIPTGPARGTPREPSHNRQNGAPAKPSAPTKPRGAPQQNGSSQPTKNQNQNNANYHKNTSAATSGKSLLQRMNIGLAERISGAPLPSGNPPTEPASSKKNKKQVGAAAGPARPNAR